MKKAINRQISGLAVTPSGTPGVSNSFDPRGPTPAGGPGAKPK